MRRTLQALVAGLAEGQLVCAADGSVLAVNEAFERSLGLPAGWQDNPELVAGVVRDCTAAAAEGAMRQRPLASLRVERRELPGGMCAISAERMAEDDAGPADTDCILLRDVLDSIDASIVVYDRDDRFVLGNRRYFELYPHLPDDGSLVGRTFEEMLRFTLAHGAPADRQAMTDPEAFVARRLSEWKNPGEREQFHPSGRWDLIRQQVTPQGHRVTLRVDITQQKRLQEELERTRDELRAANDAKSGFMAAVSHELRTPLNAVIGFAEILGEEHLGPIGSPRYREYARDIMAAGHHLLDLIGTVLDLGKIEAGKHELDQTTFDLGALLECQAVMMRALARKSGNRIRVDIAEAGLLLIGDRQMVTQMVLNLLSNALKFTSDGIVTLSAARGPDGAIRFAVEDTGCGIPAEHLDTLGERFYQASQDARTARDGTGIGLALVKEMAALHGASLRIDSKQGVGTTITIGFPAARSAAPPSGPDGAITAATGEETSS